MKRVNFIKNRSFHLFENERKERIKQYATEQDYWVHFPIGAPHTFPTAPEGYRWIESHLVPQYDTPDGELHEGEYVFRKENGEEKIWALVKGKFINMSKVEFKELRDKLNAVPDEELNGSTL